MSDLIATTLTATNVKHPSSSITNIQLDSGGNVVTGNLDISEPGNDTRIEMGTGATGNQYCYVDLIADTTYTDYSLRFIRHNGGANTGSEIVHRGTGAFNLNLQDGGTTNLSMTSDYRLKENVVAISDGITKLKLLNPIRFNYTHTPDKVWDGFIAHEAATAVPHAVTGTKDQVMLQDGPLPGDLKKGDPVYQGIDYAKVVPLLTAALQEAIAKIEVLETKVAALEAG